MSQSVPLNSARRTVTFAAGALLDADGIKTSFATVAAPVTVVPADFNGAVVSAVSGAISPLPRTITIARSNNANQFSVSPIVITGKRGGRVVTDTITPANDDGNDILVSTQAFDSVTSIAFPAQGGTGGTFTIGVRDICAPSGGRFTGIEAVAAGTLHLQYGEGVGSVADALPIAAAGIGVIKPISPTRVLTSASHTTVGVTVYIP